MAKKGIMDLFFKVEEDPKEAAAQTVKAAAPAPVSASTTSTGVIGQEDAEIKKQLADALEQANLPGYDYFEFSKSTEAQANLIPSEELRFKSTFAVASATDPKITPDYIISAAQKYLAVLQQKESEFNVAVDKHATGAVASKEEAIKKIDADMQAKADEIKKVTEDINALQQQKTALSNEISTAKVEIERVRNNFQTTLQVFVKRITSDIEKIKQYLGGK